MTFKRKLSLIFFMLFSIGVFALDVPIIFVQEQKSEGVPLKWNKNKQRYVGGWATWYSMNPDGSLKHPTVMTKIIGYKGYQYRLKVDNSPAITCDININTESSSKSDDLWIPPGLYDEPSYIGCCLFSFGAGLVGYEIYKSLKDTTKKEYYPKFSIGIGYSPGIAYTGMELGRSLETGEIDPFHLLYWNNVLEIGVRGHFSPKWTIGIGGGYIWSSLKDRSTPLDCYPSPPGWGLPIRQDWLIATTYGCAKVGRISSTKNTLIFLDGGVEYYLSKGIVYEIFTEVGKKLVAKNFGRGVGSFLEISIQRLIVANISLVFSFILRYGIGSCYHQEVSHEEFVWRKAVNFNLSGAYFKIGISCNFGRGGRDDE